MLSSLCGAAGCFSLHLLRINFVLPDLQPDFLARFFPSVLGGVEGDGHSKLLFTPSSLPAALPEACLHKSCTVRLNYCMDFAMYYQDQRMMRCNGSLPDCVHCLSQAVSPLPPVDVLPWLTQMATHTASMTVRRSSGSPHPSSLRASSLLCRQGMLPSKLSSAHANETSAPRLLQPSGG